MPFGPGRWDHVLVEARTKHLGGRAAVLLVFPNGPGDLAGSGFSVQCDPVMLLELPNMLRAMADSIAADVRRESAAALAMLGADPSPAPRNRAERRRR